MCNCAVDRSFYRLNRNMQMIRCYAAQSVCHLSPSVPKEANDLYGARSLAIQGEVKFDTTRPTLTFCGHGTAERNHENIDRTVVRRD
jgi:hypothetical protein